MSSSMRWRRALTGRSTEERDIGSSFHGEGKFSLILNAIAALLFPAYGLFRGITLIMTLAVFGNTEQEKALRAQALFMAVRSKEWMPMADERIKHSILKTIKRRDPTF